MICVVSDKSSAEPQFSAQVIHLWSVLVKEPLDCLSGRQNTERVTYLWLAWGRAVLASACLFHLSSKSAMPTTPLHDLVVAVLATVPICTAGAMRPYRNCLLVN